MVVYLTELESTMMGRGSFIEAFPSLCNKGNVGRNVWQEGVDFNPSIVFLSELFCVFASRFNSVCLSLSVHHHCFGREKEAELEEESKTEINGEGKGAVSLSCISNIIATPAFITIKQLSGNTIICSSVVCIKLFYSPQKSESHPERRICLGNLKATPRGGFVWA